MRKTIVIFLAFCFFVSSGYFLMPEEFQLMEIVKTPTLKEVGEFWYVYMDFTCPKGKARESVRVFVDECKKQGITSDLIFEAFYTWSEDDAGEIKWTMAYIVPENTRVSAPLKIAKKEKFKAMVYTYIGPIEPSLVTKSNQYLSDYIAAQGLKEIRPNYEIIRKDPPQIQLLYLVEGVK